MPEAIVVKGRLVGPRSVELAEPVQGMIEDVEVLVHRMPNDADDDVESLLAWTESLPPGTRSSEDIEAQIREERESWER